MVLGAIWSTAAVIWLIAAYWQGRAHQPAMAVMNIVLSALNAGVGAMYFYAA